MKRRSPLAGRAHDTYLRATCNPHTHRHVGHDNPKARHSRPIGRGTETLPKGTETLIIGCIPMGLVVYYIQDIDTT